MNKEQQKQSIRELWKLCFNDSEEFLDMYFKHIYSEELCVFLEQDGKVICHAQCIPNRMLFAKNDIPVGYIYGVCTHPDHRGKGLATKVLSIANSKLRYEGFLMSILVPSSPGLFDYYACRGFATSFYRKQIKEPKGQSQYTRHGKEQVILLKHDDGFYDFHESLQRENTCCLVHTKKIMKAVSKDMELSNGKLYATMAADTELRSVAFAKEINHTKELIINECLGKHGSEENLYLRLKDIYEKKDWSVTWLRKTQKGEEGAAPYGMARIINLEKILAIWSEEHPEFMKIIGVDDDHISPSNNGTFILTGGLCSKCNVRQNVERHSLTELTHRILTDHSATISLMLD